MEYANYSKPVTTAVDLTTGQLAALNKGVTVAIGLKPGSTGPLELVPPGAVTPPTGFFLPPPGAPWAATPALKVDFTILNTLPSGDWTYSGAPGGTSNCQWYASQVAMAPGLGVRITSKWDASLNSWICGAFGTQTEFTCPAVIRWYDRVATANLVGHNKVQLFWAGSWIEVDVDECSIGSVGSWDTSWARTHLNNGDNHSDPMSWGAGQPLNVVSCHEARLIDNGDGTGTFEIWLDGTKVNSTVIDATMWAAMKANKHWVGTQDEFYSIGSADKTKTDVRYVLGMEVWQPA
jgi:hypothetical protein